MTHYTTVAIQAERRGLNVELFLLDTATFAGDREAALCSVTVAELAHGVHRATTDERRRNRRPFLDDLKATVLVYPVTVETVELVGKLGTESAKKRITVPFDDLLIGARTVELGCAIATRNRRLFERIPGLDLILA